VVWWVGAVCVEEEMGGPRRLLLRAMWMFRHASGRFARAPLATHTQASTRPLGPALRVGPLVGASGTGRFVGWVSVPEPRATPHAACPSRFPFRPVVLPWTGGVAWRVPRPLVNGGELS
jgi:hypothetical protein